MKKHFRVNKSERKIKMKIVQNVLVQVNSRISEDEEKLNIFLLNFSLVFKLFIQKLSCCSAQMYRTKGNHEN